MIVKRAAVAVAGVLAAAVIAPAQAHASPCSGQSCTGLDPYATGCASSAVLAAVSYFRNDAGSGRVEMWYSELCSSNWAVTRVYSGSSDNMWAGVWKRDEGGISGNYDEHAGPGAPAYRYPFVYTGMIDGTVATCASGVNLNDGSVSGADTPCV